MSSSKLKVLLASAPGVDKYSLFQHFIKKIDAPNYRFTVGVDILAMDIEFRPGEIANLSIWNLHRKHRFDFIRSTFYKKATGAILVFDLTSETTYKEAKNLLAEIRAIAGKIPFLLIGTNADLLENGGKTVDEIESRLFAENEGGIYIHISPETISNIDEALAELTRLIINYRENF